MVMSSGSALRLSSNRGPLQHGVQQSARVGAAMLTSFFLVGSPLANVLETHSSNAPQPLQLQFVKPAYADYRAAQKRTWFRQSPKLVEGGDFLSKTLKESIDKDDWKPVEKFFEEYPSKMNGSQKDQVDQYDTYVNDKLYRPMQLLAGSFAERGSSDKQRALMVHREEFVAAMAQLEGCVKDTKEPGFFGKTIKAPTGSARKQQASTAWAAGKTAFNEYVKDLNSGLMLELNPLKQI